MSANAVECPHGRSWDACILCDPWVPSGLSDEVLAKLQDEYDKARRLRSTSASQEKPK